MNMISAKIVLIVLLTLNILIRITYIFFLVLNFFSITPLIINTITNTIHKQWYY